jgi:hypothetical protein
MVKIYQGIVSKKMKHIMCLNYQSSIHFIERFTDSA